MAAGLGKAEDFSVEFHRALEVVDAVAGVQQFRDNCHGQKMAYWLVRRKAE